MVAMAKLKRRLYKYLWLLRPLVYVGGLALVLLLLVTIGKKLMPAAKAGVNWLNPNVNQLHSFRGRVDILLLGIGGAGHDGGDLTDSMMLVSIDLLSADTVIVSLPRDIWVESLQAKLNTAYHYGEGKQPGGGLILSKAAVAEIINQPVHYGVVLDFSGFERSIDVLGGIDVNVPHGFIDNQYPIPGREAAEPETNRYETIEFKSGKQHFDGATALKYVRSRHAEGEEGTDYARAQRQQRVILAFKDRLLKAGTWLNPGKLKQLRETLAISVSTDLTAETYPGLIKLALKIKQDEIRTGVIDQGSQTEDIPALLYNPPLTRFGQWVLLPVNDDWTAIHQYIEEILYQNQ